VSQIGFDAEWEIISSCALGASQTRERLFILAYPNRIDGQKRMAFLDQFQGHLPQCDRRTMPQPWQFASLGFNGLVDEYPFELVRGQLLKAIGNAVDVRCASLVAGAVMGRPGTFFSYSDS
jgi:DNA (cytosine-5)-methyltransferase 1